MQARLRCTTPDGLVAPDVLLTIPTAPGLNFALEMVGSAASCCSPECLHEGRPSVSMLDTTGCLMPISNLRYPLSAGRLPQHRRQLWPAAGRCSAQVPPAAGQGLPGCSHLLQGVFVQFGHTLSVRPVPSSHLLQRVLIGPSSDNPFPLIGPLYEQEWDRLDITSGLNKMVYLQSKIDKRLAALAAVTAKGSAGGTGGAGGSVSSAAGPYPEGPGGAAAAEGETEAREGMGGSGAPGTAVVTMKRAAPSRIPLPVASVMSMDGEELSASFREAFGSAQGLPGSAGAPEGSNGSGAGASRSGQRGGSQNGRGQGRGSRSPTPRGGDGGSAEPSNN